jgi:hypothetical protein
VRKVLKKIAYFLPIILVLAGSLCCIEGTAQNITTDTIKPVSNFKKWYQNLLPTPSLSPRNKLRMPIPVGYTNFDDNIRDLQLMGKLEAQQSLTIRPYILTPKFGYDSLLAMIDPELENNGHLVEKKYLDIQLLPINFLQKYNSHHPYGWNDGPLSFSKGYQFVGSGGFYMRLGNIHLTLMPEFFKTASSPYATSPIWGQRTSALSKLTMGQSSLRMDLGPLSIGVSTQNLWLGPGIYSSLLMSNNAPGFNHFNIQTNRPIITPIGSFQLNVIGGTLTSNKNQGFENTNLKLIGNTSHTNYLSLLSISYSPLFFKNFYLTANRAFTLPTQEKPSSNLKEYYLIALKPLYRNVYQDNSLPIDQVLSGSAKYVFPKQHAEVYFEYGWNDGKSNSRDLILDMSHSAASIYGLKKIQYLNEKTYLNFEAEATQMSQRPSYLQRNAGNWYVHGNGGYIHENQILGAGSGWGNDVQSFALSLNKGYTKYGIKFQHIAHDPIGKTNMLAFDGGLPYWNDYAYGIQLKQKYKHFLFNLNMEWVNSKNYLWQNNNKVSNVYLFLNTIYVW